ncbi:MAG TPA: asparagine synthase-related protein [Vicinamibacterales bacterium]|nr:asparagine synthase-related protein [Vicinamibacterales bacterium]
MAIQSGTFTFDRGAVLDDHGGSLRRHPSGLAATFDGRIDNGDEIRMRLPDAANDAADADLALSMFERWRTAGLGSMVGEWALAIWDPHRRTLHLARDYMGARPLYYARAADGVLWSTDLADVVVRAGSADELSDRFAARFMALAPHPDTTPYERVHAVPPGVCVSIAATGGITQSRFWHLRADDIRYRDPRTYEEHLRRLWRDAVRSRLRTSETVWAELSGGLDSSSVACMAGLLIHARAAAAPAIRFVSHATLHSPEGDERRFIAEVERRVGVRTEIVGVEESQNDADPRRAWLTPYALHGVGLATVRRVRAGGGRLVLSGRLGDAIMGCQPDNSIAVLDDLRSGHALSALRNMRAWSRATRKPFVEIAWGLLAGDRRAAPDGGLALLTPDLRALVRDLRAPEPPADVRRSKRPLARMLLGYAAGARLDIPDRSPDVVYSYPFTHRPLVEFMLAIPGEQLSAPGATRALMRRAFATFVPPRIISRISKGYYPPAAYRAARRAVAAMQVRDLEVVQRGWIDPDRLQAAMHALSAGGGESGGEIHAVLRLEAWLQARRHTATTPQRKEVNTDEVLHA